MFTGIIESIGSVQKLDRRAGLARLEIEDKTCVDPLPMGASVAVDGVCLTVIEAAPKHFAVEVSQETLRRSVIGSYHPRTQVNLEYAMTPGKMFGGHFVTGHVDGTGTITHFRIQGQTLSLRIATPKELLPYLVPKGSICLDGISLTIAELYPDGFGTVIIPHTLKQTTIGHKRVGSRVNLEGDVLAKYVAKMLPQGGLEPSSREFVRELEGVFHAI